MEWLDQTTIEAIVEHRTSQQEWFEANDVIAYSRLLAGETISLEK